MIKRLAKLRVPLGFIAGIAVVWLARPTQTSVLIGAAIALPGELIRIWAAGHLTRWREVTRSGPYRFMQHPLYVGSSIMGVGLVVAAASWLVAVLVVAYMGATITAAVRYEAMELRRQFGDDYTAYQQGSATPVTRRFSFQRAIENREYRAASGLVIGLGLLWWKTL